MVFIAGRRLCVGQLQAQADTIYNPQQMRDQILSQLQQKTPLQQQAMQQQAMQQQAMQQQAMQQQAMQQQAMQQALQQQSEPKEDEADDTSFAPKLESKKRKGLVFVFFYMSHCPHCRRMMPAVQRMAHSRPDLYLMKCDVRRCPNMKQYMQVHAAPTSFLMRNGQWVDRIDGAVDDSELQQRVAGA